MGTLLFTLYINDICDVITNCNIILYADTCVLYTSHLKLATIQSTLQEDASNLSTWCTDNVLCINMKKTKLMLVGTCQMLSNLLPLGIGHENVVIDPVLT